MYAERRRASHASQQRPLYHKRSDKILYFALPFIDTIVAFAEDVSVKGEEKIKGSNVVFSVGQEAGVQGAMDILAK
jgi:hypothetical protein